MPKKMKMPRPEKIRKHQMMFSNYRTFKNHIIKIYGGIDNGER